MLKLHRLLSLVTTLLIAFCAVCISTADFRPGESYFGRNDYIEYRAGDLPVILISGHGGFLRPEEIPDRTYGVIVRDTNTRELTEAMAKEITRRTGRFPHVIINRLHRIKLDPNRGDQEAAQGNSHAEQAWQEYHDFIRAAKGTVEAEFNAGFLLDIHGHAHDIKRLEFGYGLGAPELNLSDSQLEQPGYGWNSSLRSLLIQRPGVLFPDLIRGPRSISQLFNEYGVPSWPSATYPNIGDAPFFNGGYTVREHAGIYQNSLIHGVQMESHYVGVRDTAVSIANTATVFANILQPYLYENIGISLGTLSLYSLRPTTSVIRKGGPLIIAAIDRAGYNGYSDTVQVDFGGTAVLGKDYTVSAQSVSFEAGATNARIIIFPSAPNGEIGDKTIEPRLIPFPTQTVIPEPVIFTLADGVSQSVNVVPLAPEIPEAEGRAAFRVTRTSAAESLTIALAWAGSGVPGLDYNLPQDLPTTATFPAGVLSLDIPVNIIDDAVPEADKEIRFQVLSGVGYIPGNWNEAILLIQDDDKPRGVEFWARGKIDGNRLLDSSGHNRHATTIPAGRGPDPIETPAGPALAFDGMEAAVAIPRFPLTGEEGFTISFHFKISPTARAGSSFLSYGSRGDNGTLNVYLHNSTTLRTWLQSGDGPSVASALDIIGVWSDDRWHHYTLTVDNAGISRVYIDGELRKTASNWTGPLDTRQNFWFGWQPGPANSGNFLGGKIRDIRIYSRALATSETLALTAGSTFEAWKHDHNLPPETHPSSDLDGDGISALLEYGFGTAPNLPDVVPRFETRRENGRLKLYFRYQPDNGDLTWRVETAKDPRQSWEVVAERGRGEGSWSLAPNVELVENDGLIVVTDDSALAPGSKGRFFRLRVSL